MFYYYHTVISLTSNHQFFSLPSNQSQGGMGGGGSNSGGNQDSMVKQRKMAVASKTRHHKQNFTQNAPIDPRTIFAQKVDTFIVIKNIFYKYCTWKLYLIFINKWLNYIRVIFMQLKQIESGKENTSSYVTVSSYWI